MTKLAWYFAPKGNRLRYGDKRPIRNGVTHTVEGKIKLCKNGLHASERIIDALSYADHHILYRVELVGEMDIGGDKIAAQSRTYLKRYDMESVLFEASRQFALVNIEKIKPYTDDYELILEWLETGNKKLKSAAESAAWAAARSARSAAWAARSAAWAAESAESAESAAWAAARSAAYTAAWAAAESAAYTAESAEESARDHQEQIIIELMKDKWGEIE